MSTNVKKIKMEDRRRIVRALIPTHTIGEIQPILKKRGHSVNEKTVRRDVELIGDELVNEIQKSKSPLKTVLAKFLSRHNKTYREADDLHKETIDDRVKARCIEIKAKMEDNFVKVMQTTDIVPHKAGQLDQKLEIRWMTAKEAEAEEEEGK